MSWFAIPGSAYASRIHSTRRADALARFIAFMLYRTKAPDCIVFGAMYLLERLKRIVGATQSSTGQRLFCTALLLSWKTISDFTVSNRIWAKMTIGVSNLGSINRMEREMCAFLGWRLHIESEELSRFEERLRDEFRELLPAAATCSPSPPVIDSPTTFPSPSVIDLPAANSSTRYHSVLSSYSPATPSCAWSTGSRGISCPTSFRGEPESSLSGVDAPLSSSRSLECTESGSPAPSPVCSTASGPPSSSIPLLGLPSSSGTSA